MNRSQAEYGEALAKLRYIPENIMPIKSKGTDIKAAVSNLSNTADRKDPETSEMSANDNVTKHKRINTTFCKSMNYLINIES